MNINADILKKYQSAVKNLDNYIKNVNTKAIIHKGYLINLDDFNNFKKRLIMKKIRIVLFQQILQ